MYFRLRELRSSRKLSQKRLAGMLDMSQTGYSKYETGERDLPTAVLIKLSVLYNTSTDYILGLTDVKEPLSRGRRLPEPAIEIQSRISGRNPKPQNT